MHGSAIGEYYCPFLAHGSHRCIGTSVEACLLGPGGVETKSPLPNMFHVMMSAAVARTTCNLHCLVAPLLAAPMCISHSQHVHVMLVRGLFWLPSQPALPTLGIANYDSCSY